VCQLKAFGRGSQISQHPSMVTLWWILIPSLIPSSIPIYVRKESENLARNNKLWSQRTSTFVPKVGIDREVNTADVGRSLGNGALIRPGNYEVGCREAWKCLGGRKVADVFKNMQKRPIQEDGFITTIATLDTLLDRIIVILHPQLWIEDLH